MALRPTLSVPLLVAAVGLTACLLTARAAEGALSSMALSSSALTSTPPPPLARGSWPITVDLWFGARLSAEGPALASGGLSVGVSFDGVFASGNVDRLGRIAEGPSEARAPPMAGASAAPPLERWVPSRGRSDVTLLAVHAAWRFAGLDTADERIDALAARARTAAVLPDATLRALRSQGQAARIDTMPDDRRVSDTLDANLWLEARLTWRLDRLVFSEEESRLERLRFDRLEARIRVAQRVVDALARWERARRDRATAADDTMEAADAELRLAESEIALAALTGGWFARNAVATAEPAGPQEREGSSPTLP